MHVGTNDIREPTGVSGSMPFADLIVGRLTKVIDAVEEHFRGKDPYKGTIFSQILPVVKYKTFDAINQWWAEDVMKKINKQMALLSKEKE